MSSNVPEQVSYNAINPRYSPRVVYAKVDPTPNNWRGFRLLDEWLNESNDKWWKLVSLQGNQALWVDMSTLFGPVLDFIVPHGTSPVFPDGTGNVTLTSIGNTVVITGSPNTINFDTNGSGVVFWQVVTVGPIVAAVNNGYFANSGGTIAFTLPAVSKVGDIIQIASVQGNWTLAQGAGQQITLGNTTTTLGAGGSLASTSVGDSIQLICWAADTLWTNVLNPVGNITVN